MSKRYESVIFDIGNVLVDWSPSYLYDKLFSDKKQKEHFLNNVCTMEWHSQQDAGRPVKDATEELIKRHPDWAHPIKAFYARWKEMFQGPIEGTVEILKELKESNRYKLYALTNWSAELFEESYTDFPFLHWFDGIVVSGAEKKTKPGEDLYKILLGRYNVDPATALFIDDKEENVAMGAKLGIEGIIFTSPQQLRNELNIRKLLIP